MPRTTDHGPWALFPCHLFIDPPADGVWNMAVDEALLEQSADEGLAALRFYQWREPTLSLGYFQRYAEREMHAASRGAAVVRRLSGGGALMHDRELTYSLCLPATHPQVRPAERLYGLVHEALIEVLAAHGVTARLHQELAATAERDETASHADDEPFLCFTRRTAADVVLTAAHEPGVDSKSAPKIVGSAQRRRRGAVLQHGAVLLQSSPSAPELLGLARPGETAIEASALIAPWSAAIAHRLNLHLTAAGSDSRKSLQLRNQLVDKHGSAAWLERR